MSISKDFISRVMRLTGKLPLSGKVVETVLSILKEHPNGATTKDIFHRATPKAWPSDPSSEHPFKSVRYLKKTVLETMQERSLIEKFHVRREPSPEEIARAGRTKKQTLNAPKFAFLWRIHDWEQSREHAKAIYEARQERRGTREAERASPTSEKARA